VTHHKKHDQTYSRRAIESCENFSFRLSMTFCLFCAIRWKVVFFNPKVSVSMVVFIFYFISLFYFIGFLNPLTFMVFVFGLIVFKDEYPNCVCQSQENQVIYQFAFFCFLTIKYYRILVVFYSFFLQFIDHSLSWLWMSHLFIMWWKPKKSCFFCSETYEQVFFHSCLIFISFYDCFVFLVFLLSLFSWFLFSYRRDMFVCVENLTSKR